MKIGSINIEHGILLAPMEDVTDLPFRLICKRFGADIVYTEFVNSDGLSRGSKKTQKKMFFREEERPLGIQIYGGEIERMATAAEIAESFQPDLIDINCGCWVKDVAMRGAGAGLLRDIPKMERLAASVVRAVKTPVTLKTRLGWDPSSIRIVDVAKMCEQIGIQAITIHCRTRDQGHKGPVDYSWIPRVKEAVSIPVIVNGDVVTPENVRSVFETTGADAVMIGRGAILNPWIFREAKHYLKTGELLPEATLEERVNTLREHLDLAIEYKGERVGVIEMRKHYAGYLRHMPMMARIRAGLMTFTQKSEIDRFLETLLETYPHGEIPEVEGLAPEAAGKA